MRQVWQALLSSLPSCYSHKEPSKGAPERYNTQTNSFCACPLHLPSSSEALSRFSCHLNITEGPSRLQTKPLQTMQTNMTVSAGDTGSPRAPPPYSPSACPLVPLPALPPTPLPPARLPRPPPLHRFPPLPLPLPHPPPPHAPRAAHRRFAAKSPCRVPRRRDAPPHRDPSSYAAPRPPEHHRP